MPELYGAIEFMKNNNKVGQIIDFVLFFQAAFPEMTLLIWCQVLFLSRDLIDINLLKMCIQSRNGRPRVFHLLWGVF